MESGKLSGKSPRRALHLHIGLPKTASTWLQEKVFTLLQHLEYLDCPKSSLFEHAREVAERRLLTGAFRRSSEIWRGFGDEIFKDLLGDRQTWLTDGRDLLISDEGMGRQATRPALFAAHIDEMQRKAKEWGFGRLNIVCIIRRQDHWLASHYAQMSDRNPIAGQADFECLVREVTSPQFARYEFGMLLDFSVIYDQLREVVGTGNLLMLPYELLRKSPEVFLPTLLERLDTPSDKIAEIVRLTRGTTANVRSEQGIWRLRPPAVRKIGGFALPNWSFGKREHTIELTSDISRSILSAYSMSNQALAAKIGVDLDDHGYFDFH
ncbi:hypothetical protein Q6D67_01785 [Haliea sp. E1-2-M8]|uniref:hypothetical protein n=1 Tax=Haliea sp. E1-2-M8 TaxID=3064706 RepID=UPI00271EEF99|nr:hypothetical protein [Haliea sp. E1-2-M8]MDO8860415.1 hypothetical protein [Haliea sp. E1-2-M8]